MVIIFGTFYIQKIILWKILIELMYLYPTKTFVNYLKKVMI
ncbi:hypothetical protein [Campylobacter phage vB_CcoM-IBB_35]|uniref:Uncharacterized protein n=1 Tax=Campylobacter virus IBB35 TaxID=1006972 RepID=H6SU63_9CAUD|nr:hypothetical protein FDG52_s1gp20 [Campylobacter phage vB_CcoM-IBB_35]AEF56755.1 hypothetical protein [Campylobacter phage vB_CcoM-IBB_35]